MRIAHGEPVTHPQTLISYKDDKPLWRIIATVYGLPLLVGAVVTVLEVRISSLGDLIGGLALVAGFLFALVIFVFELRMRIDSDPRAGKLLLLPRLIDELFANTVYAVGVAVVACVVAVVASATMPLDHAGNVAGTYPIVSAVLLVLCAHLVALIFLCLRRTRTAYGALTKRTP